MHSAAFAVALFAHIVSFAVAFGAVVVVDAVGFLWLLGRQKFGLGRVVRVADITQPLIWLGFTGLVVSGIYMQLEIGAVDAASMIKFGLVLALALNGLVLHQLKKAFSQLPEHTSFRFDSPYVPAMFIASAISQVGWWGAALIGFVHAYTRRPVSSPVSAPTALAIFYAVWLAAFAITQLYQRRMEHV